MKCDLIKEWRILRSKIGIYNWYVHGTLDPKFLYTYNMIKLTATLQVSILLNVKQRSVNIKARSENAFHANNATGAHLGLVESHLLPPKVKARLEELVQVVSVAEDEKGFQIRQRQAVGPRRVQEQQMRRHNAWPFHATVAVFLKCHLSSRHEQNTVAKQTPSSILAGSWKVRAKCAKSLR